MGVYGWIANTLDCKNFKSSGHGSAPGNSEVKSVFSVLLNQHMSPCVFTCNTNSNTVIDGVQSIP